MTKLSRQDVYDIAHKYYADGGAVGVSDNEEGGCVYFAPNNGHCAIGCVLNHLGIKEKDLIDEEHTDGTRNVDQDAMDMVEFLGDRFTDHVAPDVYSYGTHETKWEPFIMRMQRAHDSAAPQGPTAVASSLETFARNNGLIVADPTD